MLSWIRQRIESIFWALKDRLGLERHRARPLHGLRARIAAKLLALAAGVGRDTIGSVIAQAVQKVQPYTAIGSCILGGGTALLK